jgi:hypothetical protein
VLSRTLVAVAIVAVALAPAAASAQTRDPSVSRTLNGHTFIPSAMVGDPFVSTLVRTETGGGLANKVSREIEDPVLDSLIDALVGDLAFMSLAFEYQYAFTDWLAVAAEFSGTARLGTGAQSVLAEGITSMFGVKLRATARVLQTEKWIVSTTLRYQPNTQYRLDILNFVKRAIDEGQISEDNSVVIQSDNSGGALGVGAAYAPKPWLGFVFQGEGGYANTENRDATAWKFGGIASFDLNPLYGVPLGFTFAGFRDSFVLENSDITDKVTSVGWGVAYTGRDDFSLSLETARLRVPLLKDDQTIGANLIRFNIRYYF